MTDLQHVLDAIDGVTTPACGWCSRTLAGGPSDYFCDSDCQHF